MSITIVPCPECLPNSNLPYDQWQSNADPDCAECQGSGTIEVSRSPSKKELEEWSKMVDDDLAAGKSDE
ncbi:MAG: hypothetical protein ACXAC5_03300 [Promethearchaeota archaeon]|jgi:hypothetical protein